jgi:competence protein ComEC
VLFRRPARYLDDGVPDAEEARALRGVSLLGSVKSGLLVERWRGGDLLSRLGAAARWRVRDAVQREVGPLDATSAAILTAVLIGDERGIPDEVRQRWQRAGIYHVLAISGGNIAVLVMVVMLTGRAMGGPPRIVASLSCMVLVGFAVIVAPGASVERATVMALLVAGAQVLDHRTVPWQAWSVAVATMVVRNPLALGQPALLLTCGATAALLAMAAQSGQPSRHGMVAHGRAVDGAIATPGTPKVFQRLAPPLRWILAVVIATLGVEAAVFPVGVWFFGQVSLAGVVLNVLAIPLMTVAQLAGMGLMALDAAGGRAWAHPLAWAAQSAVWTVDASTQSLDALPWLSRALPRPPGLLVALYYAALATSWRGTGWRRLVGGAVAAGAAGQIVWGTPLFLPPAPGQVRLTMLDVGQGESLLVESGAHALLVDTGGRPFGDGTDIGRAVVAPALWARGRRSLDAMLVTHADPDHVGGAVAVFDAFDVGQLWLGVDVPRHEPTRALLAAASREPSTVVRRLAGDAFTLGRARMRVLHPPAPDWERRRVRNDDSIVLEIVHGDVALLLLGDVGVDVERRILPLLTPARVRILKVAHHGSRTSTSTDLVQHWRPDVALVSCGRGNSFGHPAPVVLDRLRAVGADVVRTDQDGQITVHSDGTEVRVETFTGRRFVRRPPP